MSASRDTSTQLFSLTSTTSTQGISIVVHLIALTFYFGHSQSFLNLTNVINVYLCRVSLSIPSIHYVWYIPKIYMNKQSILSHMLFSIQVNICVMHTYLHYLSIYTWLVTLYLWIHCMCSQLGSSVFHSWWPPPAAAVDRQRHGWIGYCLGCMWHIRQGTE